jgi:predicted glycosyltransferase
MDRMASIWLDLDNAPHVPLFRPLVRALRSDGHPVLVTFRDHGYVAELLRMSGIGGHRVGRHFGKRKLMKVAGLVSRSAQLGRFAAGRRIDVAVSHGSRALVLACAALRIPCVTMYDYEFVSTGLFNRLSRKVMLPDAIPEERFPRIGLPAEKVIRYPGFKEEIYLGDFEPDSGILRALDLDPGRVIVVLRPPATMAHYHRPESDRVFGRVLERLRREDGMTAIVLPRTPGQAEELARSLADRDRFRVLTGPVHGLNLLWHSDLVVGGGGTMNREAALMGVPVYSTFMGERGALDDLLARRGRLRFVESAEDAAEIPLVKRTALSRAEDLERIRGRSRELVAFLVDRLTGLAGKTD